VSTIEKVKCAGYLVTDAPNFVLTNYEAFWLTKTKVSWLQWSEEAFRRAKELDRPVLLSISAVWCHWCHVMDQTTYSDSEVARLIEENFVPLRVDRDRRPDIDRRYNMGGWSTTVFLTPDGEVLMGGTYIPPGQMMTLMAQISGFYKTDKEKMKSRIEELKQQMKAVSAAQLRS